MTIRVLAGSYRAAQHWCDENGVNRRDLALGHRVLVIGHLDRIHRLRGRNERMEIVRLHDWRATLGPAGMFELQEAVEANNAICKLRSTD